MSDEIKTGALTAPGQTPTAERFPPLTEAEQETFALVEALMQGGHGPNRVALMRIEHEGRPRAVICMVTETEEHYDVRPLVMLVDDSLFAEIRPDGEEEAIFEPEPQVVHDMLLLVYEEFPAGQPTVEMIRDAWSEQERRDVYKWALAVHLVASDNDDVEIPPMPEILR